ncbi:hypothetical protein BD770DRAFT_407050 [Pilaira anomala]|nr:hypothetical protein BD770DRAFT_407050 [Pilaira anomala]
MIIVKKKTVEVQFGFKKMYINERKRTKAKHAENIPVEEAVYMVMGIWIIVIISNVYYLYQSRDNIHNHKAVKSSFFLFLSSDQMGLCQHISSCKFETFSVLFWEYLPGFTIEVGAGVGALGDFLQYTVGYFDVVLDEIQFDIFTLLY